MGDNLSEEEVTEVLEQADEREVYNDIVEDEVQAAVKDEVQDGVQDEIQAEALTKAEAQTRRLLEENERLREEIERVRSLPMKERLYDHVHVSVRTMDIFIGAMLVLAVIAVILGMT